MNKYTSLLQKYLKILIFTTLILSLFVGFGMLFRTSKNIETNASRDPAVHKTAFFQAMHEHDLGKGRLAYNELKKILPPQDPFLTEIAPAYLADLYVQYAKILAYDQASSSIMLAQARQLVPDHPDVLAMQKPAQVPEEPAQFVPPNETIAEVVVVPAQAPELLADIIAPLMEHIQEEIKSEVKDGPPRIPFIDPPPLIGFSPEPEYELMDEATESESPAEPEIASAASAALTQAIENATIPTTATTDPCSLSYLTKIHPLTPCIDTVTDNRFGPAMFVVGKNENEPTLAFTQHPITSQDYAIFCDATGQCYEEVQEATPLIDLSEVQEMVHDYNAYCQMSGTCDKINPQAQKQQKPLTRGQAQRYALWLSKTTGYKYRHITAQDTKLIQGYFQGCVSTNSCAPGILDSVALLMEHPDTVLVREVK